MNPSADESLAFFKTNREVRLEQLLRKFTALDDGDAEYWWAEDHRDLIVAALEELGLRDSNAAGQVKTAAGEADRATVHRGEGLTAPAASSSDTPLTDANILTEIPEQMWMDSDGVKRQRVLADFARHLEIENNMLRHHMRRLMSNAISAEEWYAAKRDAAPQALAYTTPNKETGVVSRSAPAVAAPKELTFAASYKNGYETAIETAAQHVEGQLCVWDHTGVITSHVLQTIAKNIRALNDAPQPHIE